MYCLWTCTYVVKEKHMDRKATPKIYESGWLSAGTDENGSGEWGQRKPQVCLQDFISLNKAKDESNIKNGIC